MSKKLSMMWTAKKESKEDIPGLKNMYRIVAVFLCTLNGWPVSKIRLAMILVGSGFMNVPIATR
jgi:hypothetical protein